MDDMISRQAAIDAAVKMFEAWYGCSFLREREIRVRFDALPSAQQWIPCSERLPEEEKAYLVTFASGNVGMSSWHKDTLYNRGFDAYLTGVTEDGGCEYFGVVAWMEKPEPWEGEKHGTPRSV